ncbi:hypothetical protein JCM21900_004795 [Sporobolomyces salmonicolor]
MSSTLRQLTIKTGVVNRLVKEVSMYKEEAAMLKVRADAMEARGDDEYEVRQQRKVHADSVQMIPDSEKRLAKAISELEELLANAGDEIRATDEYKKAEQAFKAAKPE